jgi:hypothetical protein
MTEASGPAVSSPSQSSAVNPNFELRLRRHPDVETEVIVLDDHHDFAAYARAYGDRITDWYEQDHLIVLPHVSLPGDINYLSGVTLPERFKKIGLTSGIARHLVAERLPDGNFKLENPLWDSGLKPLEIIYLHQQIVAITGYLLQAVPGLFPHYRLLDGTGNITFRLCPTRNEDMHIDHYSKATVGFHEHRLKLFINLDSEQRYWRIGDTIFTLIRKLRDRLPRQLPETINEVSGLVNHLLADMPAHDLLYPRLSCIIGNGETIAHQVLYGNRVIGFEWRVDPATMRDREALAYHRLQRLRAAEPAG